MPEEFVIRPYQKKDRNSVRDIAYDTAFMGDPAHIFFDDREILSDILTAYFTDYEPQSCFVAEKNGAVVGYLIGTKSIYTLRRVFILKILPRLFIKTIINGTLLKKKNIIFIFNTMLSFLKGELRAPYIGKYCQAKLHIDVRRDFRNSSIGSRLMETYLNYLNNEKVPAVCLATRSDKAARFFEKQGFRLVYKGKRSYLRHILRRDVSHYFYVKQFGKENIL